MPVKRRVAKRRPQYPDAIERLIAGEPVEETEENRSHLIGILYFDEFDDLPPGTIRRAMDTLAEWRAARGSRDAG